MVTGLPLGNSLWLLWAEGIGEVNTALHYTVSSHGSPLFQDDVLEKERWEREVDGFGDQNQVGLGDEEGEMPRYSLHHYGEAQTAAASGSSGQKAVSSVGWMSQNRCEGSGKVWVERAGGLEVTRDWLLRGGALGN